MYLHNRRTIKNNTMHYKIPSIIAKIESLEQQIEDLPPGSTVQELDRLQDRIDGLEEQLADLQQEDSLGINDGYQID
jgi:cell division protein FtsB